MPGIICPIRGGPESRPTIKKAIRLALETHLPLIFLYVVNLDFLSYTESSRTRIISHDMRQMGDFILLLAREAAQAAGVTAEGVVRHGDLRQEIIDLADERRADCIVMGRPLGEQETDAFTPDRLEHFIQQLEDQSGAKVVMADEES